MAEENHSATVTEMLAFIKEFRDKRGWTGYHDPYDLAVALSVEASEILELLLWSKNIDLKALIAEEPKLKERLGEEIIDAFAYTLVLADAIGVDLTEAFYKKMAKNAKKYPVSEDGSMTPRRKRWLE